MTGCVRLYEKNSMVPCSLRVLLYVSAGVARPPVPNIPGVKTGAELFGRSTSEFSQKTGPDGVNSGLVPSRWRGRLENFLTKGPDANDELLPALGGEQPPSKFVRWVSDPKVRVRVSLVNTGLPPIA